MLVGLLVACSSYGPTPNRKLIKEAIALQLSQTQANLTQQLNLPYIPPFEINRIKVKHTEPLTLENLPAFHIVGTYDLTLKLRDREGDTQHFREVKQAKNSFEVYLQRQIQGQTWRLAKPQPSGDWYTYLIR